MNNGFFYNLLNYQTIQELTYKNSLKYVKYLNNKINNDTFLLFENIDYEYLISIEQKFIDDEEIQFYIKQLKSKIFNCFMIKKQIINRNIR